MTSERRADRGRGSAETPAEFYQSLVGVLAPPPVTVSRSANSAPPRSARVFKKGGVITSLAEYSASSGSASATAAGAHAKGSHIASSRLGPQIGSSNVGYQLLKRAGWQEGQGLGSSQQGRSVPLAAYQQQAREGVGAHAQPDQASAQPDTRHRRNKQGHYSEGAPSQRPAKRQQALPVPDVPEDLEVRRKRHQQMIQSEADEEERKAIQQHIYRAFNDFSGEPTSDSNPLARSHKLSRTNPLL